MIKKILTTIDLILSDESESDEVKNDVKILKNILEKGFVKSPKISGWGYVRCPCCNSKIRHDNYCSVCGQKIKE